MTTPSADGPRLPSRIGPFTVVRLLGAGGMGRVYLAATRAGRPVAVKVVRESYAQDLDFRRRFRVEAEAAMKVGGAFTAPVLAADPDAPLPWLATAYLPAPSLSEVVATHGPMPPETVRALAAGLAEALTAVHAAGLVHRDLKPSNILLAEDGPRLIDFGLARALDAASLTGTGQILGTAGYLPPEQIAGRTATAAGDVFALGATLVFAATGRGAFGESSLHVLLYRTAYEEPDLSAVPEALRPVLAACLEKDPWQRPEVPELSARFGAPLPPRAGWLPEHVREEVRRREEAVRTALTPHLRSVRRGRRRFLTAGGALAVGAVTGGWWFVRGRPDAPSPPRRLWRTDLPKGFERVRQVSGGRLLLTSRQGAGAAVMDPDTRKVTWRRAPYGNTATTAAGGVVYVIELDGAVHARDVLRDREHWSFAPPDDPRPDASDLTARPGADGWVYVTSQQQGRLYALGPDGTVRWHREAPRATVHPRAGVVLCVTRETGGTDPRRTVRALDARTGERVWAYSPAVFGLGADPGGRLTLALRHDTAELVALRLTDGKELWRTTTGLDPGGSIQNVALASAALLSADGRTALFQKSLAKGSFAALDTADGRTLWREDLERMQQLVPLGDALLTAPMPPVSTDPAASSSGPLAAYDLRTGTRRWRTQDLGEGVYAVLRAFSGMVLLGADGGDGPGLYGHALGDGERVWELTSTVNSTGQAWSVAASGDRLWAADENEILAFEVA